MRASALLGRLFTDDDGALAPAVPIVAIMFLLLAGLVIDSSRQLTARARAVSYAEEAARAGASAVDPASDPLLINTDRAAQQVREYCALVEQRDAALSCAATSVTTHHVTVTASYTLPTGLLGIVGINTLHAKGEGEARPLIGVTEQDAR
jgi:Putative Flp pilus-assembly TadE/G-like